MREENVFGHSEEGKMLEKYYLCKRLDLLLLYYNDRLYKIEPKS